MQDFVSLIAQTNHEMVEAAYRMGVGPPRWGWEMIKGSRKDAKTQRKEGEKTRTY